MNFHEYQAKQLFADYGIAVPAGRVARTPEEAVDAAKAIGGDFWVVKAQIHAGGRGKAGGVKLARTLDEVREYAKGMLVQVKKKGERRTWLVYGDIYRAYRKAGGPKGKLGVPTGDPRCGLPEAGCIQRFTKAAIYDNKSTKGVVQTGKGRRAEILAVARSQVGYSPSRKNATKYNKWVGSVGQAWCSSFLSWVSYAAGTGKTIPRHKRLTGLLKDIRENKVMKTGSAPKKGALVFFDTFDDGVVEATHVGIVVKVKSSTIVTVEANTSNPKNSSQRGVYQKERQRSRALFYAYPEY